LTSLAPHMEAFLREHLARLRGASQHTCDSYAYSFQSLFAFASQKLKVAPSALLLEQLDAALIGTFLVHLETIRGNSAETRNIRLAAIRSFFRFLQHREPAAVEQVRRVLAIPFKKTDSRLVPYLIQDEMQALLDSPDPSTREGVRDRAMLHLAVCAGLRVSELTGLRLDDVAPQSASIRVRGKGRRERALPLWKTTAAALRAWLTIRGPVTSPELFVNARSEPFSRWGVAYVLRRHTKTAARKCSTLNGKQVSPHVLRNASAYYTTFQSVFILKIIGAGQAQLAAVYGRYGLLAPGAAPQGD
jgi:integrase/recombinase XerD